MGKENNTDNKIAIAEHQDINIENTQDHIVTIKGICASLHSNRLRQALGDLTLNRDIETLRIDFVNLIKKAVKMKMVLEGKEIIIIIVKDQNLTKIKNIIEILQKEEDLLGV